jgi:hypothetical protein
MNRYNSYEYICITLPLPPPIEGGRFNEAPLPQWERVGRGGEIKESKAPRRKCDEEEGTRFNG